MNCTINIFGPYSTVTGDVPISEVAYETSYFEEGAKFVKAYKMGTWDGRKHLFNKRSGAFPTGLLSTVKRVCEEAGAAVEIVDHRMAPRPNKDGFELHGVSMTSKYDYQMDACKAAVEKKQGIIKIATGGGKTGCAVAIAKYLGLPTLMIVPTRELMHQTRKSFMKFLQIQDPSVIGIIGDGFWEPGSFVTIAITDTLESRLNEEECIEFLSNIDVLFMDEAHRCGSETYFKAVMTCPAYYRIALSATPLDRTDGANLRILAATGDIVIDIPNKLLVDRGVTAKADIIWDKVAEPVLSTKQRYVHVYKQGVVENKVFAQRVVDWTKAAVENNLTVVIMVEEIEQGKMLDEMLWTETGKIFIPHQFIHGNETPEVRDKALRDFGAGELPVLIISRIGDEGIDLQNIHVLLLAGSRKSKIRTLQRLGRGLRGDRLIVVEFANYCHKYLIKHSLERLQDYKREECFPIHQFKDGTDKTAMIKRLWDAQDKVNETRMKS